MKTLYRKENGKIVGINVDDKKAGRMLARGWSADRDALAGNSVEDVKPAKRGRKKKDADSVD